MQRAHILVVDYDANARTALQRVLESRYAVTCLDNTPQAVDALASTTFDAVIIDVVLHSADGFSLLEHIRKTPATRELPVLLVTTLIDTPSVSHGLKLGANDYVTRPLDASAVHSRLDTQLSLKRLQAERDDAMNKLDEAGEMRNRLFRVATHDLKNPLANIRMAEYVLREAVNADPVASQMMDTVTASLDGMQEVLDDFMNAVILQSGQFQITLRTVNMERAVYRTLLQYNLIAEKKSITIIADDVQGEVYADEARLAQIVANLVSNAIKFSPGGSTVRLKTEQRGDKLRLSVIDKGPGIPENERYLLFTEFGKLSVRPTGQESSTGLGLWIVKTLVDLMDGDVGVETPEDGGSVFWVDLPLKNGSTAPAETRDSIIPFPGSDSTN